MFCKNCGQQNADGVKFCGACGSPMVAPATVGTAPPSAQSYSAPVYGAPVPQKSNGKIIAIVTAIVAAVAVLVVILVVCLGGDSKSSSGTGGRANTPEDVAEAYVIASLEYDADALVDCTADCVLADLSENLGYKNEINTNKIVERLEEQYKELEEELGKDEMYLDYEIISVERDEDWNDAKDTFDDIEDDYGYEAAEAVTEVCRVIVKAEVDGEDRSWNVYMALENGNWKVIKGY